MVLVNKLTKSHDNRKFKKINCGFFIMKKQQGFNMIEVMLTMGISIALFAGVWGINSYVQEKNKSAQLIEQTQKTIQVIQDSAKNSSNFEALTIQKAYEDGAFNNNIKFYQGRIIAPWGGEISIAPEDVQTNGTFYSSGGWALVYSQLPSTLCVSLLSNINTSAKSIYVNDQKIMMDADNKPNVASLSETCNESAKVNVQLSFQKEFLTNDYLVCEPPQNPRTRTKECDNPDEAGVITEEQRGTCPSTSGEIQWGDWTEVSNTCQPCPSPETRTGHCPNGQYGSTVETREYDCKANTWKSWITEAASCQPCEDSETRTSACPNGQVGTVLEKRTFFCLNGTWGPWAIIEQNCNISNGNSSRN